VTARPLVGAPGTRGWVSGPLAWLELPEQAGRLRPGALRNQIVAIFGPLPTSAIVHRRLVAARPLAVIHVDDRLPFAWPKHDGVYPHWVRRHGMPPMLTVPYRDAWRWRVAGTDRLRVRVTVDLRAAASQNVIAELPGTEPGLPPVVLTAHHDTQCGNPGADDNASGVVCLLALARALAGVPRRRTVRFISFGTEEQLSVGSAAYVRRHRATAARTGLVINLDSVASPLGHWEMYVTGSAALARHAQRRLTDRGLPVVVRPEVIPFSDQFPFNRVGVPSLWFMRTNFPGGRWQHHSRHDTLANVSVAEVQRLLTALHPLIDDLASRRTWPFPGTVPTTQLATARRIGRELYG
jgi:Iap family predicted aminopeptidase